MEIWNIAKVKGNLLVKFTLLKECALDWYTTIEELTIQANGIKLGVKINSSDNVSMEELENVSQAKESLMRIKGIYITKLATIVFELYTIPYSKIRGKKSFFQISQGHQLTLFKLS